MKILSREGPKGLCIPASFVSWHLLRAGLRLGITYRGLTMQPQMALNSPPPPPPSALASQVAGLQTGVHHLTSSLELKQMLESRFLHQTDPLRVNFWKGEAGTLCFYPSSSIERLWFPSGGPWSCKAGRAPCQIQNL